MHVGAKREQRADRVGTLEERREPEREEAVTGHRVHQRRIACGELTDARRVADGRRLEDVQVGLVGEQGVRDLCPTVVVGEQERRGAVLVLRPEHVRICAHHLLDGLPVASLHRVEEVACHGRLPLDDS
jgi:hypothetical protein